MRFATGSKCDSAKNTEHRTDVEEYVDVEKKTTQIY